MIAVINGQFLQRICLFSYTMKIRKKLTMNRNVHIIITVILILIASRFAVRIADSAGKISDIGDVLMLVIPVIAVTGMISYAVYRYRSKHV